MICATMKDAKARLNRLVQSAEAGESVVLMRGSRHVAAIVPISEDDLDLKLMLSDAQATRFWEEIENGALTALRDPKDLLA
jgi:antitoxin (DNA-binding transcriptional repressor) of toxin-antitoxin stability system